MADYNVIIIFSIIHFYMGYVLSKRGVNSVVDEALVMVQLVLKRMLLTMVKTPT